MNIQPCSLVVAFFTTFKGAIEFFLLTVREFMAFEMTCSHESFV